MLKRPKPGEDEEDILKMQEEYLREVEANNIKPAAQVVNMRTPESVSSKNADTSVSNLRKPSKYAQSKRLKNYQNQPKGDEITDVVMGDVLEKNAVGVDVEDDKVYFPTVNPSVLGNVLERNVSETFDCSFKVTQEKGFPDVPKWNPNLPSTSKTTHSHLADTEEMDVGEASNIQNKNLPPKSYILSSKEADAIHTENVTLINKMSEEDILQEQQKLLLSLDPKIVAFVKSKRNQGLKEDEPVKVSMENNTAKINSEQPHIENQASSSACVDSLWENDVLSHPNVNRWLNFDSLEKDKLEWIKSFEEVKKLKPDEHYEARFNFSGYLLPYAVEYTEETKTLFHHGDEPNRPGYTLSELFELTRSTVIQQRVMALNTLAGVLEYHNAGIYKDIIEIPLSKIFFIVRIAMDENKVIILEPALKAMRNLLYNRIDEASLDALLGLKQGSQQPCLENDKSEIEELESQESEFRDFHLSEIDIIAALLRTDILQRLFYILETVKPNFNCAQYALQILTRLTRDSLETSKKILNSYHLMKTIIEHFVPTTSVNFAFGPEIVYNGKPILAALKFLRILSSQSEEVSNILVTKYDIIKPLSEYVSSGVDGTYGVRLQIEAICILTNLLYYNVNVEGILQLSPVIMMTLYKHVKGTDIFLISSILTATHAAVLLQLINMLLNSRLYLYNYKVQIYPLLKEGVQKWLAQLSHSDSYTCGHLRLLCSALDCCKTISRIENIPVKFLTDSLKSLASSRGFANILKNVVPSSNLLSGIENKKFHLTKNLMSLGSCVIDSTQKILPILNVLSPIPLLASLFNVLALLENKTVNQVFINQLLPYLNKLVEDTQSLCDNWFTRIEANLVYTIVKVAAQSGIPEEQKDLFYMLANKLCYIVRKDKQKEFQYLYGNFVFNTKWFTADRLLNLVSISDQNGLQLSLSTIAEINSCYNLVVNFNPFFHEESNLAVEKWREPILPRDWIYSPILQLYSGSQENMEENNIEEIVQRKIMIISYSLKWILFNELCYPDLLKDIDSTDKLCRFMCVFLCDNSLFLDDDIKLLLQKCIQILFRIEKTQSFNFDKQLIGLSNFQDLYIQFLEQFQSVSYGDPTFAACVLAPLAQKHNIKWRKLLWSEYAGCLRALDCPEELLCYEMEDYFYPEETDESLIESYFHALSSNLLRPDTIAYKIAEFHVKKFNIRLKLL